MAMRLGGDVSQARASLFSGLSHPALRVSPVLDQAKPFDVAGAGRSYPRGRSTAQIHNIGREKLAHPTEFEFVTSAFGEWIIGSAETNRFYPIARYAYEITKQI